jgi:hypothetical protein
MDEILSVLHRLESRLDAAELGPLLAPGPSSAPGSGSVASPSSGPRTAPGPEPSLVSEDGHR